MNVPLLNKTKKSIKSQFPLIIKIISLITIVILIAPMIIVVLAGLNSGDHLTFPPQGISLRWVIAFFQSETFLPAYVFSLKIAITATIFSTILGTIISFFLVRTKIIGRTFFRAIFLSPLMLPGIVIGLSLYLFYLSLDIGLSRSLIGLIIGHILVTCPYVIAAVSASLVVIDKSYEEAARSLGGNRWQVFRRVTLPLITPAIIAGATFSFIVSFGQFDVSLFLTPADSSPLPLALYISLRYTFEPTAAAAGIFAIILVIASTVLATKFMNLKRLSNAKPS